MSKRIATCTALLVLASSQLARAQSGGSYALTWNSIDCGSPAQSSGAGYLLGGTTGQPEAGRLSGAGYVLDGGFGTQSLVPTDAAPPDETDGTALVFRLHGNVPNPFKSSTAIAFTMPREADVELHIYNLAGRLVRTVLHSPLNAGRHQAIWDGNDDSGQQVSQGVYFMRLRAGTSEARRKIVLLR
jgi:hypothetical protein